MRETYIEPLRLQPIVATFKLYKNGKIIREWKGHGGYWLNYHHYPEWLGLKLHLIIERQLVKHYILFPDYIYHLIHGFVCGYKLKDILNYIKLQRGLNAT